MFEKFDFSWFTTIPGILTGIGCLLILVSIIIFITSLFGKKKKNTEDGPTEEVKVADTPVEASAEVTPVTTEPAIAPVEVAPVTTEPTAAPVEVTPVTTEPTVAPVEVTPVTTEPTVAPVEVTPVTTEPTVAPVEVTPVTTEPTAAPVEVAPVTTEPTVAPVEVTPVTAEPTAAPVEITPTEVTPVAVEPQSVEATPEVAPSFEGINIEPEIKPVENTPENASLPYGGAEITPNITPDVEAPKVIYGGADPTEGTGMIPKVETPETKTDEIESL